MVSTRLRAYLLVGGFFVLGSVGGAAAGRAFTQRELASALLAPDHRTRDAMFLDAIARELDLDAAQRAQVAEIHQRHRTKRREWMQAVTQTCGRPIDELHAEMEAEVASVLDQRQRTRWNELSAQRRARRAAEMGK